MVHIIVNVDWCNKNFAASLGDNVPGSIVVTDKTYEGLKKAVKEALEFHIEGMLADGDNIPEWLEKGEYTFDYVLTTTALLRSVEKLTTIAAISRVTGINEQQLSHYANGVKKPRLLQRKKIEEGIKEIGNEILAVI